MKLEFEVTDGCRALLPYGVSVVVPCFNAGDYLESAVSSVLRQNLAHDEFEVIIINDGSTDEETLKCLDRIEARNNANVRGLHQENKGQSATRNRGIREANFAYIAGLDADDMYASDPKFLGKYGLYLQRAAQIGVDEHVIRRYVERQGHRDSGQFREEL
ncbi:MAG: glycosyltransferase family 2 protein [Rhodospirillales bacterium]|nr:glycosyltransferase family 2 protein [Alphaproteobacteria bacterium]USO05822.1 MAG: glycosyltransferase family 2 protein [Rhodospirillales bacterium]